MSIFKQSEIPKEEFNYDTLLTTLDIILSNNMIDSLSPAIKEILNNSMLEAENDNVKEALSDILNYKNQEELEDEYFWLFSLATQKFIIDNLPNGAKWKLIITIDDTLRWNEFSNKNFIIRISWLSYDGNIIDHDNNQYKNIGGLKTICKELSKYHYLWLWIKWWLLESIEINKPKYSNVSKIDEETWKKRIIKSKNREIIKYPIIIKEKVKRKS